MKIIEAHLAHLATDGRCFSVLEHETIDEGMTKQFDQKREGMESQECCIEV